VARMIPPFCPPNCESDGEKEIFRRLASSEGTESWVVLHSLDIAKHKRQICSEADFVILAPERGVLCLEVKGCKRLVRENGLWYYGRSANGDPRGPFKQSAEAMHSIRQYILTADSSLSRVPFFNAAVFPFLTFAETSGEWHPWQVIDIGNLRRATLPQSIGRVFTAGRRHLSETPSTTWFREVDRLPSDFQVESIASFLRPRFEILESPSSRRRREDAELNHYTTEQFAALDSLVPNRRVLFTGPAGTGKTTLAIETARRAALFEKNTLVLCFNRHLGQWLAHQCADIQGNITCRTLHQFLLDLACVAVPKNANDEFWRHALPELALRSLLDGEKTIVSYDVLVLDEAQDVFYDEYLDVLDLVLKGGLAAGSWRLFGDFEHQAIFRTEEPHADLTARVGEFTQYSLRLNCRNRPRVATFARLLGGLKPDYLGIRRPDNGIEPEIHYYTCNSEGHARLIQTLEALYEKGYRGDDIVILSPLTAPRSAASRICRQPWANRIRRLGEAGNGYIRYTTVHAFKGLEARCIVVTDIEEMTESSSSVLFYIAVTRSTETLSIIANERTRTQILSICLGDNGVTRSDKFD